MDEPVAIQLSDILAAFMVQQTVKKQLAPFGLTSADMATLLSIRASSGQSISEICRGLGMSTVNMAAVMKRLGQRQLIERVPWDGVVSRRLVIYQLSETGLEFLERFAALNLTI